MNHFQAVGVCRPNADYYVRVPRSAKTRRARGYASPSSILRIPRWALVLGSAISVEFAVRVMSRARTAFFTLGAFKYE